MKKGRKVCWLTTYLPSICKFCSWRLLLYKLIFDNPFKLETKFANRYSIDLLVFSFPGYRHVGLDLDSLELEEKIVNSFLVLSALLELKKVSVRLKLQIYIY